MQQVAAMLLDHCQAAGSDCVRPSGLHGIGPTGYHDPTLIDLDLLESRQYLTPTKLEWPPP
jgi:hypothetical protein